MGMSYRESMAEKDRREARAWRNCREAIERETAGLCGVQEKLDVHVFVRESLQKMSQKMLNDEFMIETEIAEGEDDAI